MSYKSYFYRVRDLPHQDLNGRVVELIAPSDSAFLERVDITVEEFRRIRGKQDVTA